MEHSRPSSPSPARARESVAGDGPPDPVADPVEFQLHEALERGELSLAYQPIVDLAEPKHVVDVEALLRWNSPVLGSVPPLAFIPTAERTGAIVPIGAWVLAEACRRARAWSEVGGYPVRVSVNLSGRQVREPDFVEMVGATLRRAGIQPDQLTLEITESVMLDDDPETTAALWSVADLGVRLVLDDFGTGYSSLSMLKRIPLTGVKIDREFVAGLPRNRQDAVICQAIVDMARALRLRVTAEGIETDEQATFLTGIGVDLGQGFLFGRPNRETATAAGAPLRRTPVR